LCLCCLAAPCPAGDLAFRRHVISEESEFSAVAVLDVNHDGKLDILCGGFWYQAPTWQRHFVRNVERIRGRFDGYAHLPLDVNGDGWTDVITVNFRSASIRWTEHPGPDLGPWSIHTVEEPGPMETGRLFDVDGDGRLDVLANGQRFAAWWEVRPGASGAAAQWTRNNLPAEIGGHGMGFGDINGDGRGDVLGPNGWAEAPPDRRTGKWVWHQEFTLGQASVPVIVADVDRDGDSDLVWSRAHGFGVYWTEQSVSAKGNRTWTKHTIDSSWSQCHSPLWADMDGDGQSELVAGKRYLAHEGLDPGAYDPVVSYRYQFDRTSRTWQRWAISEGQQVGYGLDPKVVDLDGDNDLDLVVCGRSGLYWLENEGPPAADRPKNEPPTYPKGADLHVWRDADGLLRRIETPFHWGRRRAHIVASIEQALGRLPKSHQRVPLDPKVLNERIDGKMTHRTVSYRGNNTRVITDVWMPTQTTTGKPGLIVLGMAENDLREFASRGYVCVSPHLSESRAQGETDSPALSRDKNILNDVWHCIRAVDLLESMSQVNAERIGGVGHGIDAQRVLLTSVFDQRIAATWCSGELSLLDNESAAKKSLHLPEFVAAIAPRSLALQVSTSSSAQEKAAFESAVEQATLICGLYRRSELPTIEPATSAENSRKAHDWLDAKLNRRGSSRRPPSR
jgi:hypothetical protein